VVRKICMDTLYPFFMRDSSIFRISEVCPGQGEPLQT
jgi:hypothetical protein